MAPRTCLALLLGALIISPVAAQVELRRPGTSSTTTLRTPVSTPGSASSRAPTSANCARRGRSGPAARSRARSRSRAELVFVGSDDNVLRAYHARREGGMVAAAPGRRAASSRRLPSRGDTVYGYTSASVVTALDAADGHLRWSRLLSRCRRSVSGITHHDRRPRLRRPLRARRARRRGLGPLDAARTSAASSARPRSGAVSCSSAAGRPSAGGSLRSMPPPERARWSFRPQAGRTFAWSGSPAVGAARVFQAAYVQRGGTKRVLPVRAQTHRPASDSGRCRVGRSDFLTSSSPAVAYGTVFYVSPGEPRLRGARVDREEAVVESDRDERVLSRGRRRRRVRRGRI